MKRDKRANRETEKAALVFGMPVLPATDPIQADSQPTDEPAQPPSADDTEGRAPEAEPPSVATQALPPSPTTSASPLVQSILRRIAERSRNA